MSTRCRIGMELPDGKIKSIYCHNDGYPEGVGKTLKEFYTEPKKIEELLSLGDVSGLGSFYDEDLAKKRWEMTYSEIESSPLKDKLWEVTTPYKDRGEKEVNERIDADEFEFLGKAGFCGEEYVYLFKEDYSGVYRWHFIKVPYFEPLD